MQSPVPLNPNLNVRRRDGNLKSLGLASEVTPPVAAFTFATSRYATNFVTNFTEFAEHVEEGVRQAGPKVAAAA